MHFAFPNGLIFREIDCLKYGRFRPFADSLAWMASDSHLLPVDSYNDPLFIAGFIKENDQIGNLDIISSKVVRWI